MIWLGNLTLWLGICLYLTILSLILKEGYYIYGKLFNRNIVGVINIINYKIRKQYRLYKLYFSITILAIVTLALIACLAGIWVLFMYHIALELW